MTSAEMATRLRKWADRELPGRRVWIGEDSEEYGVRTCLVVMSHCADCGDWLFAVDFGSETLQKTRVVGNALAGYDAVTWDGLDAIRIADFVFDDGSPYL